jgi:hypothetical protein
VIKIRGEERLDLGRLTWVGVVRALKRCEVAMGSIGGLLEAKPFVERGRLISCEQLRVDSGAVMGRFFF